MGGSSSKLAALRVVVIGGNFAGIAAAHALLKQGFSVTVIEVRDFLLPFAFPSYTFYLPSRAPRTHPDRLYLFLARARTPHVGCWCLRRCAEVGAESSFLFPGFCVFRAPRVSFAPVARSTQLSRTHARSLWCME
jgi:hypothetical protein